MNEKKILVLIPSPKVGFKRPFKTASSALKNSKLNSVFNMQECYGAYYVNVSEFYFHKTYWQMPHLPTVTTAPTTITSCYR